MGLGYTSIYGGIPGDITGIYKVEAPPPLEHVSGLEGTGHSLEEVASHVYKTQLLVNPGLAGEWTRVAGEQAGEDAFVSAYTTYMNDAGPMYRDQPLVFQFLKEQVFLGRDYTAEWAVDEVRKSAEAIEHGWVDLAANWESLTPEDRQAACNQMEAALAEAGGHNTVEVIGAQLPEGCNAVYDPTENTVQLDGITEADSGMEQAMRALLEAGHHCYQMKAIGEEGFHPIPGQVNEWAANWEQGYRDAESYGYELYVEQPLEQDATAWAGGVLGTLNRKAALRAGGAGTP